MEEIKSSVYRIDAFLGRLLLVLAVTVFVGAVFAGVFSFLLSQMSSNVEANKVASQNAQTASEGSKEVLIGTLACFTTATDTASFRVCIKKVVAKTKGTP